MTVYADEVFFLNALLDFLLLQTANLLSDSPKKPYRAMLAAVFGGIYAVLAAVLPLLAEFFPQLLAFTCICILAYGASKVALRRAALLLLTCCGFGGITLLTAVIAKCQLQIIGGLPYYQISKRLLILLAGGMYAAVWVTVRRLCRHMGGTVRVTFSFSGQSAEVTALCDTGNTLKDPMTAEPVVIADLQTAQKLLPLLAISKEDLQQPAILVQKLRRVYPASKPRLLPYRTVGQTGMLAVIRCDTIRINGKQTGQHLAAFSSTAFTGEETYQALTGGNYEFGQTHTRAPAFGTFQKRNRAVYRRQRYPAATAAVCGGAGASAKHGAGQ